MKNEEAYKILEQVCAQFRGTLQEHQAIQQALSVFKPQPVEEELKQE